MSDEKNKGYFDLSKALDEVRHESFGAKETAVAGLKLFGKGMFNAARFAVKEVIPAAVEQTAKHNARTSNELLKREGLTDEQRDKLEKVREKSETYLAAQEQKRREQEAFEEELERERARAGDAQNHAAPAHREIISPPPPAPPAATESKTAKADADAPLAVASSQATLAGPPPELADYLRLLEGAHERIYVGQHIPENKLENAWKGRPAYCRNHRALLLADDTVMGGGKDGLLITDEHISFKAAFSDAHNYAFKFAQKLTVPEGFKFHLIPSEVIDTLLSQLRAFFADRLQWHEHAAENDDRNSQFFLSTQYGSADERGPYWLIRAAQAGHATAQHNLGMNLKASAPELAMHWFELAAAQGHELALTRLTDMRRAAGSSSAEAGIPKGAIRLIDLMSPQAVRELDQNIDASRQAMHRAMQRIADEERRL